MKQPTSPMRMPPIHKNGKAAPHEPIALHLPGVSLTTDGLALLVGSTRRHQDVPEEAAAHLVMGTLEALATELQQVHDAIAGTRFPAVNPDGTVTWVPTEPPTVTP